MNKEEKKAYMKEYRLKNKEKIKEQEKRYREEHKEHYKELNKQWYDSHKDYHKQWRKDHKEELKERNKNSQMFRANMLVQGYKYADRLYNRGEGDLTSKWIVEHIFSQPCAHCGKTGWDVIGCNRLDNSKPHTMDNVEPCCEECNVRLYIESRKKPVYQYTLDKQLVGLYESAAEAARVNGFDATCIFFCCNGGYYNKTRGKWVNIKKYKDFIWSYEPL